MNRSKLGKVGKVGKSGGSTVHCSLVGIVVAFLPQLWGNLGLPLIVCERNLGHNRNQESLVGFSIPHGAVGHCEGRIRWTRTGQRWTNIVWWVGEMREDVDRGERASAMGKREKVKLKRRTRQAGNGRERLYKAISRGSNTAGRCRNVLESRR